MKFVDRLKELFRRGELPPGVSPAAMQKLQEEIEKVSVNPPRIALIGETGVGKTSTVNALFNKGLEISHVRACTKLETEIVGDRGEPVRIIDMPGLGEDVDSDKAHWERYAEILPQVDLAVWILKADSRAMTHVQQVLDALVKTKALVPARLVLALNQVDLLQPGKWDPMINMPSPEQEATIGARRGDVLSKVRQVVSLPNEQVVAYSALKHFNLDGLFEAMLLATAHSRRWQLYDRASRADFNEFVEAASGAAGVE